MKVKILICLSLSFVSAAASLLAQNWKPTDRAWTDKNNTEQYVAYLIKTTYYQQGYCAAKVEAKSDDGKRLFIVEPGNLFHVNDIVVKGLNMFSQKELMQNGPKTGDVFSPLLNNDWAEQVRDTYVKNGGPLESLTWGIKLDYTHFQVSVQVNVNERN